MDYVCDSICYDLRYYIFYTVVKAKKKATDALAEITVKIVIAVLVVGIITASGSLLYNIKYYCDYKKGNYLVVEGEIENYYVDYFDSGDVRYYTFEVDGVSFSLDSGYIRMKETDIGLKDGMHVKICYVTTENGYPPTAIMKMEILYD